MTQSIVKDAWGRPKFGKAKKIKLKNGVIIESGNTKHMNYAACNSFLSMVHQLLPWQQQMNKYPHTIWRNPKILMIIFLRCYCDGLMTKIWNRYYHWTSIRRNEIQIVDDSTPHWIVTKYNLSIGAKYWHQPKTLFVVDSGDGFKIPVSPEDIYTGCAGILKIHVLDHQNLLQTLYVGVPYFLSGLSHYNPIISNVYHMCSKYLGRKGGISFYTNKGKCFMLSDYYRYDNGDWPWLSTVVHRCMTHSGSYPFIYWIKHIGKKFVGVRKNVEKIFEAVKAGIKDEHMPWNLNLNDINDNDIFYTLTTDTHWQIWMHQIEEYVKTIENYSSLTQKQKHVKRRKWAIKRGQSSLYAIPFSLMQYLFDLMHGILRHGCAMSTALNIFLWCVCSLSTEKISVINSHTCMFIYLLM